jgi:nicotianamine synthase
MADIERKTTTHQSKSTTPVDSVLAVTPPVTPNATSTAAHRLVSEIREIYTVLSGLSSLAPSEQVNSLLTQLVNLCVVPYSTEFTSCFFRIPGIESLCSNLRPLCSEAEGELEKFWAKRMLNDLSSKYNSAIQYIILNKTINHCQRDNNKPRVFSKPSHTIKTMLISLGWNAQP